MIPVQTIARDPAAYFKSDFAKIPLGTLVGGNVVLIGIAQVVGYLSAVMTDPITAGNALSNTIFEGVAGFLIMSIGFSLAATLFKGSSSKVNPETSLKILFSGTSVQFTFAAIVAVFSLIMIKLSAGYGSNFDSLSAQDPGAMSAALIEGMGLSGVGMVLFVVTLAGVILSLRAQYVGLKDLYKFSSGQAMMTILSPVVVALVLGYMRMSMGGTELGG